MKNSYFFLFFLITTTHYSWAQHQKMVVVFVADGVGHHVIQKLHPFFISGLQELLEKGIVYENTYHPHASPTTAPGHTTLATGAFPDTHGVVANWWFSHDGTKINTFQKNEPGLAIQTIKSFPEHIMVEGISDQLLLASQPHNPCVSYALSFKDRASIPLAGKLGKAIWFDYNSGEFTSGSPYFNVLPEWLKQYNKKLPTKKKEVLWKQAFFQNHPAYNFRYMNDYRFSISQQLVGTKISTIDTCLSKKKYKLFTATPTGQNMLFDCAKELLSDIVKKYSKESILLWISISSPDKIGHWFGPDSLEYIDLMYHLDLQIGNFMTYVKNKFGAYAPLFIFTADHGSTPIVEFLQEQGITSARRINTISMVQKINQTLRTTYQLENDIVLSIQPPQVYCNELYLDSLLPENKLAIIETIKKILLKQQGICRVWTNQERDAMRESLPSLLAYYQHQWYPGRAGLLMLQVEPYTYFSQYSTGTGHCTPYEYDTHVPLIVYDYKKGVSKKIFYRVWTTQLAPTLASIFNIPKPSGALFDILPEFVM